MKTIIKQANKVRNTTFYPGVNFAHKVLLIIVSMTCILSLQAQKAHQIISISGSQFADPLLKKWITEYAKVNSGVTFKFVKNGAQNENADLKISLNKSGKRENSTIENQVNVGRLAVLPVANANNRLVAKQLKNGIKQEEFKSIFLLTNNEEGQNEEPLYTVYTQTPQSATAGVLLDHFGEPASELNGVTVTGEDKYLIESVLKDSTGVTYSNLGLIYDLENRTPLDGLKILPIDLDDNGKLKKEEMIYDNLDQVITFLETTKNKAIPVDNFSFSFNSRNTDPSIADFVNWVTNSGQQFNHQFGFLKTGDEKSRVLTQN